MSKEDLNKYLQKVVLQLTEIQNFIFSGSAMQEEQDLGNFFIQQRDQLNEKVA